jgi:hypothetical protein
LFEAYVLALAKAMPIANAAKRVVSAAMGAKRPNANANSWP